MPKIDSKSHLIDYLNLVKEEQPWEVTERNELEDGSWEYAIELNQDDIMLLRIYSPEPNLI